MLQFLIGLIVGGTIGVIAMCLLQINRGSEEEDPTEQEDW